MENHFIIACLVFLFSKSLAVEIVHTTKFFVLPIEPKLFNWTLGMGHEFEYSASLLKAPDLPSWIQYTYSRRHRQGFLYGVPPSDYPDVKIEIIALNKGTYETRRRIMHLNIHKKTNPAKYEVHLKIDYVNVDDFFDSYRLSKLLDIFKNKLWKESFTDLYVTFMTSAVNQGARLPLKPSEGEGVVMKLGSVHPFSSNLIELHEEVKPLLKLPSCPREYKRTTVERWFREEGFVLDWCSFRLVKSEATPIVIPMEEESPIPLGLENESLWTSHYRSLLPERSYSGEFAVTILVPMFIMVLLVVMLSVILCFQHECMDEESEVFFQSLFQICEDYSRSKRKTEEHDEKLIQYVAVQRATNTLRSLSQQPENCPVAQASLQDDDVNRPNPPPYAGGTLRTCQGEF